MATTNNTSGRRLKVVTDEAIERYRDIVRRLAADAEPVGFVEVCAVLSGAGRTSQELAHDIAAEKQREGNK